MVIFEIWSSPISLERRPTNGRIIISERFSQRTMRSEPHIGVPRPGVLHQEDKPPEYLASKVSEVYFQDSQRARGNREFILKGTHKISHALGLRA